MSVKKDANASVENRRKSFDFEDDVTHDEFVEEEYPSDIVFPQTLNLYLRRKIQEITSENGCLQKALEETEEKFQTLENTIVSETTILPGSTNETTAKKIVLLSKMCKDQVLQIETLTHKCKTLEEKLIIAETQLNFGKSKINDGNQSLISTLQNENCNLKNQLSEKDEQIKALNEKINQANAKIFEVKNTNSFLKQEINKAQKLLCSEVGENVTIAGLCSQPIGWRGRAEQIQILQKKVFELQGKLSEYDGSYKISSVSIDSKAAANIRNLEKERRQQIENSARELRQAEVALENTKRKLEAAKARIRVLENELCLTKRNVILLNENRSHDDQLIEALNGQLKAVELRFQDREVEIQNQKGKLERKCVALQNELEGSQVQINQLRKKLEEREKEIEVLKSGGTLSKQKNPTSADIKIKQDSSKNSARSTRDPNEYVVLGLAAEAERERLLELVTLLNRRLDKERNETDRLSESFCLERKKMAKLETKIQKLEMERAGLSRVNSGYRSRFAKTSKSNDEILSTEQSQYKIALLEEECLALKTRLATVQRDKAVDLEVYKQMLDQTRKIFHDAFKEKSTNGGYQTTLQCKGNNV